MQHSENGTHQVAIAFLAILVLFGGLFIVGMTSLKANIASIEEAQAAD